MISKTFRRMPLFFNVITILTIIMVGLSIASAMNNNKPPKNITVSSSGRRIVSILTSVNFGGSIFPSGDMCTEPKRIALEQLKSLPNFLPNYELSLEIIDDECDDVLAISRLLDTFQNPGTTNRGGDVVRFPLVQNANCPTVGQRITALMSNVFNYVGFTTMPESREMVDNRQLFRSMFTLTPSPDMTFTGLFAFLKNMSWTKIGVIADDMPFHNDYAMHLLKLAEQFNVTLVWMGKIFDMTNDEEVSAAFNEIKSREARIIISYTDYPITVSCWLHRLGMYGPSYTVFFTYWNYFEPATAQIPNYIPWCNKRMLAETVHNSIFHGDAKLVDVNGPAKTIDSTGLTGELFYDKLKAVGLKNPEENFWATICYDEVLFAGFLLNATENLLNSRNQTLADWDMAGVNFQKNPSEILAVIKEALYSFRVSGIRGEYQFERRSAGNWLGFLPVTFTQLQRPSDNRPFEPVLTAVYRFSTHELKIDRSKFRWRTKNNQPPRDSVVTVPVQQPFLETDEIAVLLSLGISEIVGLIAIFIILISEKFPRFSKHYGCSEIFVIFGNVVMLSHLLATPATSGYSQEIGNYCSAIGIVLVVGFSVSMSGLFLKLTSFHENQRSSGNNNNNSPQRRKDWVTVTTQMFAEFVVVKMMKVNSRRSNATTPQRRKRRYTSLFLIILWNVASGILIAVLLFHCSPFIGVKITLKHYQNQPEFDPSVTYKPYRYECQFAENDNISTPAVVALLAALQIGLIFEAGLTIYQHRHLSHRSEFKRLKVCILCEISLIVATVLLTFLNWSDGHFLHLLASSVILCFCAINICFVFIIKTCHF